MRHNTDIVSDIAPLPVGPVDAAVAGRAACQHGNVTRAQLLALGVDDNAIAFRLRAGRLHRVHRGVYAVGRPAREPLELAAAAVLACGADAVISHASALALWGLATHWPTRPVVTVSGGRRPAGVEVHRSRVLTRADTRTQLGIRATSPARTILDCAPEVHAQQRLARLVNDALLSPFLARGQLADVCGRFTTHPGARLLRPFVVPTDGPTRSEFEDRFLRFCAQYGFPRPLVNVPVGGHLVDALFAADRLIVELDGWDFHHDRLAFERDRDRDADALVAGLRTLRITWDRLVGAPETEASRLRLILARAGATGRPGPTPQRLGDSGAPPS